MNSCLMNYVLFAPRERKRRARGGGGLLGLIFAGYVPLTSQSPYPMIVYSVASYRPHQAHLWANVLFSQSQLGHMYLCYIE